MMSGLSPSVKPNMQTLSARAHGEASSATPLASNTQQNPTKNTLTSRPEKAVNAKADTQKSANLNNKDLSESEKREVAQLKKRDQEVRQHEQAHKTVGGSYASAPTYEYTKGPDGKRYAVGGEVKIDASPEKTPQETLRKMDIVIRAALAPAEPSSQDRAVARQAQQHKLEAQRALQDERKAEQTGENSSKPGTQTKSEQDAETKTNPDNRSSDNNNGLSSDQIMAAIAYAQAANNALFGGA